MGCDTSCPPGTVASGDACVEPVREVPKADAATPEPKAEPQAEPGAEPKAEPSAPDEPGIVEAKPEPRPEPLVPDEPAKTEPPALDAGPKETPKEEVPEPIGPAPTVAFTEPQANAIVSDTISIKVDATVTGAQIAKVDLFLDGNPIHTWSTAPFEHVWNSTGVKDGKHKLLAVATTNLGKKGQAEIEITTANSKPEITFVSPTASAGVLTSFDIEVKVTSVLGIKAGSVKLEVEGVPIAWTQTMPTYKASFDPKGKAYGSFPIYVVAEDTAGEKAEKEIWVIHEPPVGTKKANEECDDSDANKRCIKDHSCVPLTGVPGKLTCQKHCTVGGATSQCPLTGGKQYICQVAFQNTTRGVCAEGPPQPGQIYSRCSDVRNIKCKSNLDCNSNERCVAPDSTKPTELKCIVPCLGNLLCVGAQRDPQTGSLISFCLNRCTVPGQACTAEPGFTCVGLQGGGGACIEQCGQACTADANCAKNQKCQNGTCSAPFCQNYGQCLNVTGLNSKICI